MDPETAKEVVMKFCQVSVNLKRFDRNQQQPTQQQTMYNCKPSTSASALAQMSANCKPSTSAAAMAQWSANQSSKNKPIEDTNSSTPSSSLACSNESVGVNESNLAVSKKSTYNGDSQSAFNSNGNNSSPTLRKRRRVSLDNGDHQTLDDNAKLPPSVTSPKMVKKKRKQVAFERKLPPKANSSAASSLKTLRKYRNTRNSNTGSPDKVSQCSPLKPRVMPKRKPKTEFQKRKLYQESDDEEDGTKVGMKSRKIVKSSEGKKPEPEDEELATWLNNYSHEEYALRPRAAAIAAAKKGKLGNAKNTRAKGGRVFRAPRERVPKGRSRHALKKRAAKPKPIRCVANDNEMTFCNSLFCGQTYFQIGDIVSIYADDGMGPFYLQVQLLCTDEYFREIGSLRWLVPKTPFATKLPFDARNYKYYSPTEKDITRFLTDVTLIAHCPLEYFGPMKDILYNKLEKGTIYIRLGQSLDIMGTEKVDFPELKAYREKQRKELEEMEQLEKKEETTTVVSETATTEDATEDELGIMPPPPSHPLASSVSTINDESKIMPPPPSPLASTIIDESNIMPPTSLPLTKSN